jgi:hypothetical protein
MSSSFAEKGGSIATAVLGFLFIFAMNILRRLLILSRYSLICWQHWRLKRAWRRLGRRVDDALEEGEVNPLLTEPVKDALERVQRLKALKGQQYEAIAASREKIRRSRRPESEAPPEETVDPEEGAQPEVAAGPEAAPGEPGK